MSPYWKQGRGWFKSIFQKPAGKAVSAISHLLSHAEEATDESGKAVISLMKSVLWADGKVEQLGIDEFQSILSKQYSPRKVRQLVEELKQHEKLDPAASAEILKELSDDKKAAIVKGLIALALSNNNYSDKQQDLISQTASILGISDEDLSSVEDEMLSAHESRRKLLKSGAGIIVALIVIFVFILTATLLKSVLFGLILAYIFLPLEKWYEKKLYGNGFIASIFKVFKKTLSPVKKLSSIVRHKPPEPELTEEEIKRRARKSTISRATTLTVSTFVILALVVVIFLTGASAKYVAGLGDSARKWFTAKMESLEHDLDKDKTEKPQNNTSTQIKTTQPVAEKTATITPQKTTDKTIEKNDTDATAVSVPKTSPEKTTKTKTPPQYVKQAMAELEKLKPKFQKLPLVRWGIERVSAFINDTDSQKAVLGMVLKKTGGIFTFTAGVLSRVFSILLNVLLTIFFFSLFLNKMAEFCSNDREGVNQQSEYLVRTIFNGKWLPGATEESIAEGQRIISEVINKLKTWLKGYLTLICIDLVVYSTVFTFLGVPYSIILGFIAALGILLPYIGPVASACLTVLVTLAVGGADVSMMQILGIICIYLLQNGVIEQLFLYPAVIGESLGLTTLETIIVVLLGGIFAGITGMIFAIPAAAVLKYLVPQIYNCWK